MKAICVTSGGMDSISMALKMLHDGNEVVLFHGDLKQKSETGEHKAVEVIAKRLGVPSYFINISWLGELGGSSLTDIKHHIPLGFDSLYESTYIKKPGQEGVPEVGLWTPARNVVLLACAAAYAERFGAEAITWGANQSETAYPDNTIEFADRFSDMLELGCLKPPQVISPLYNLDKVEILLWGFSAGFRWVYDYTWSCDAGYEYPCGSCGCCCNRRFAFQEANKKNEQVVDRQIYINQHYFTDIYLEDLKKKCTPQMWMHRYLKKE
uniref:7-cyano-7-deazaguanine synthase n=1 Tax=viral metagenome TaxID=1070528 RepID=A0A6M3KXG6_9ZZZZ